MEFWNDLLDLIGKVSATFGIDFVLVILIVFLAQIIKHFFAPNRVVMVIVLFGLGALIATFNIVFVGVEIKDVPRMILGYPVLSMAVYMYAKKRQWFKKYLKSTSEIKDEKET